MWRTADYENKLLFCDAPLVPIGCIPEPDWPCLHRNYVRLLAVAPEAPSRKSKDATFSAPQSFRQSNAVCAFLLMTALNIKSRIETNIHQLTKTEICEDKKSVTQPRCPKIDEHAYWAAGVTRLLVLLLTLRTQTLLVRVKLLECAACSQHREHLNSFGAFPDYAPSYTKCNSLMSIRLHSEAGNVCTTDVVAGKTKRRETLHVYQVKNISSVDANDFFSSCLQDDHLSVLVRTAKHYGALRTWNPKIVSSFTSVQMPPVPPKFLQKWSGNQQIRDAFVIVLHQFLISINGSRSQIRWRFEFGFTHCLFGSFAARPQKMLSCRWIAVVRTTWNFEVCVIKSLYWPFHRAVRRSFSPRTRAELHFWMQRTKRKSWTPFHLLLQSKRRYRRLLNKRSWEQKRSMKDVSLIFYM